MFTSIKNFFTAPQYEEDPEKTQDARTTHRVAVALLALAVISLPFISRLGSPEREYALYGTAGGTILWFLTIILVKRQKNVVAKIIILGVNSFNLLAVTYITGGFARPTITTTLFLLAMASLLFPIRGAVIYGAILLISSTVLFSLGDVGLVPAPTIPDNELSFYLVFIFTLIATTIIQTISSSNLLRSLTWIRISEKELKERNLALNELREQLELRVEERTAELEQQTRQSEKRASRLEAISEVANTISSLQEINQLLPYVAKTISERFDFYHTGIFLLSEDRKYAILQAVSSEGGQQMLARKHKLRIGQEGIVGFAVSQRRARIALDVGEDAVFFDNPELPATRSELALPLIVAGDVIGVLDVQSEEPNAFSNEDIEVLTTLANQVAVAIQNARLFEQSQKAMQELETTFQRYISSEWQQFSAESKVVGYRARQAGLEPITDQVSEDDTSSFHNFPLKLRGVTLGKLNIKMDETSGNFSQEEIGLIQAIADRLVMALESARLLEDSQRTTAKEQVVGEIATKIGASINMRNVLQTAVEELGRAIPGSEVVIQLEGKNGSGGSN